MSVPNEDTGMVMRPIVHESWKSVLSETIHARRVCGTRRQFDIPGTGAMVMINGMSSYRLCISRCSSLLFDNFEGNWVREGVAQGRK